jgi:hypothetical protein
MEEKKEKEPDTQEEANRIEKDSGNELQYL